MRWGSAGSGWGKAVWAAPALAPLALTGTVTALFVAEDVHAGRAVVEASIIEAIGAGHSFVGQTGGVGLNSEAIAAAAASDAAAIALAASIAAASADDAPTATVTSATVMIATASADDSATGFAGAAASSSEDAEAASEEMDTAGPYVVQSFPITAGAALAGLADTIASEAAAVDAADLFDSGASSILGAFAAGIQAASIEAASVEATAATTQTASATAAQQALSVAEAHRIAGIVISHIVSAHAEAAASTDIGDVQATVGAQYQALQADTTFDNLVFDAIMDSLRTVPAAQSEAVAASMVATFTWLRGPDFIGRPSSPPMLVGRTVVTSLIGRTR